MKQLTKTFLFSNFKSKITSGITKNELTINEIKNLTTKNNIIEPTFDFEAITSKFVNEKNLNHFHYNNVNL